MTTRDRLAEALADEGNPQAERDADALLPVVEQIAAERAAEELEAAIKRVQAVYDLQCPAMPADRYVGAGAYSAHKWWETVLGGALDDLRARAAGLTDKDGQR